VAAAGHRDHAPTVLDGQGRCAGDAIVHAQRPGKTLGQHEALAGAHGRGFGHLLEACRILAERGIAFECQIVGDGPLRDVLAARILRLDLGSRVSLLGALPHETVLDRYREATVFALPCVTGPDGDRDGIPNVILEAMAMGLPVVSTRHSGIPEAVEDGASGLLVPPGDEEALAQALVRLIDDPPLRERLGRRGRERVRELFDVDANAMMLLAEVVA